MLPLQCRGCIFPRRGPQPHSGCISPLGQPVAARPRRSWSDPRDTLAHPTIASGDILSSRSPWKRVISVRREQEHPLGLGNVPSVGLGTARPQGPSRRLPPCRAKESQDLSKLYPRKALTGTFSPFCTRTRKPPGKGLSVAQGLPSPSSSGVPGCAGDLSHSTRRDCHRLLHPGAAPSRGIHLPSAWTARIAFRWGGGEIALRLRATSLMFNFRL